VKIYRVEYIWGVAHCGILYRWIRFYLCPSAIGGVSLLGLGWLAHEEKLDSKGIDWRLPGVIFDKAAASAVTTALMAAKVVKLPSRTCGSPQIEHEDGT